jgi:hypothetical protein
MSRPASHHHSNEERKVGRRRQRKSQHEESKNAESETERKMKGQRERIRRKNKTKLDQPYRLPGTSPIDSSPSKPLLDLRRAMWCLDPQPMHPVVKGRFLTGRQMLVGAVMTLRRSYVYSWWAVRCAEWLSLNARLEGAKVQP